jgi:hypothetical protein
MKGRNFVAGIATAGWLAVSAVISPAPAALMTGQFSMTGTDIYDLNANTISFLTNTINVGTGAFVPLAGTSVVFTQGAFPAAVNYTTLTGQLFTGAFGLSFAFTGLANFLEGGLNPTDLTISGPGVLTLAGFDNTPGTFSLTTQGGGSGGLPPQATVTFSSTTVAVPGPLLGAGLPGLLAAVGGLVALARTRRRRAQLA